MSLPAKRRLQGDEWFLTECFCCGVDLSIKPKTIRTMQRETLPFNWTWMLGGERNFERIMWEGITTYAICDLCNRFPDSTSRNHGPTN